MKNYKNIFVKKQKTDDKKYNSYNNSDIKDNSLYIDGKKTPFKVGNSPYVFNLNESIDRINKELQGVKELLIGIEYMKNGGVELSKALIINKDWFNDVHLEDDEQKHISINNIHGEISQFSLKDMYSFSSTVLRKEKGNDLFSSVFKYYSVPGSATVVVDSEDGKLIPKDNDFIQYFIDKHVIPSFLKKNNSVLDSILGNVSKTVKSIPIHITGSRTNISQLVAIGKAQSNIVTNIQGPPGTGKTTLLKDLVSSLFLNDKRLLVLSSNNKAVDNVRDALLEDKNYSNLPMLRLGNANVMIDQYKEIFIDNQKIPSKPLEEKFELIDASEDIAKITELVSKGEEHMVNKAFVTLISGTSAYEDVARAIEEHKDLNKAIASMKSVIVLLSKYSKTKDKFLWIFSNEKKKAKLLSKANTNYELIEDEYRQDINKFALGNIGESLSTINIYFDSLKSKALELSTYISDNSYIIKHINSIKDNDESLDNIVDLQEKVVSQDNNMNELKRVTNEYQWQIHELKEKLRSDIDAIYKIVSKKSNINEIDFKGIIFSAFLKNKSQLYNRDGDKVFMERDVAQMIREMNGKYYEEFYALHPIIFTTTLSIGPLKDLDQFDYGIIDEAAQTTMTSIFGLTRYIDRLVLLGDTKQLPAVTPLNESAEVDLVKKTNIPDLFRNIDNSIPKVLETMHPRKYYSLLNEHWRCSPDIANFFNVNIYNSELIIRTKNSKKDGFDIEVVEYQTENRFAELKKLVDTYQDKSKLAIITPHRADANKIGKEFKDQLDTGTVHSFQGYENRDIIYWMGERDEPAASLIDNPRLVNVAVSRAKETFTLALSKKQKETITKQPNHQTTLLINYINNLSKDEHDTSHKLRGLFDWLSGKPVEANNAHPSGYALLADKLHGFKTNSSFEIDKTLFSSISEAGLNITMWVRKVDVVKDSKDFNSSYDFVIFDNNGVIKGIVDKDTLIYKDNLDIKGVKESIDDSITVEKIMTKRELQYFNLLNSINKDKIILPSIALNRVIQIDGDSEFINRTSMMHFDYAFGKISELNNKVTIDIEFLLELDDSSHESEDAKIRDSMKDEVSRVTGFELIRVKSYV